MGWKIVAIIFGVLGGLLFLLSTVFLTNWSETALVNGSYGLVFGGAGYLGAYLGRSSIGKAIIFAVCISLLAIILLSTFFGVVWPML